MKTLTCNPCARTKPSIWKRSTNARWVVLSLSGHGINCCSWVWVHCDFFLNFFTFIKIMRRKVAGGNFIASLYRSDFRHIPSSHHNNG